MCIRDSIIIIKFFNKKVVKRNFTNGKENGVQIIDYRCILFDVAAAEVTRTLQIMKFEADKLFGHIALSRRQRPIFVQAEFRIRSVFLLV